MTREELATALKDHVKAAGRARHPLKHPWQTPHASLGLLPDGTLRAQTSGYAEPGLERLNNDGWLDRLQKHPGNAKLVQSDCAN